MDDELKDIWKDSLKDSLTNLSGFVKWLLVLNLTIALTYCVQYLQLKKQKEDVKKYDLVTKLPWNILRVYYSNISADSIANYETTKIFPMLQLGELDILSSTMMINPIAPKSKKQLSQQPTLKATVQERKDAIKNMSQLQFAFNSIVKYSSSLTEIAAVKRDAVHFESLDQKHLNALIDLWDFDTIATKKPFSDAWKLIIKDCEGYHNNKDSIKFFMIYASPDSGLTIPPAPKKVLDEFSFAFSLHNNGFLTFNQQSVQVMSDFQTFFQENLPDSLRKIKKVLLLDSSTFESIGTSKNKEVLTENKIEDFESGSSISIPLTSINISLIQFVTVAGIINLFIILYFLLLCKKVSKIWANYCKFSTQASENISGYFYNWTYGINTTLFIILFGGFLSFSSLISLLFSILLYPISDNKLHLSNFLVIVPFALVNFIFGIIASQKFVELNKFHKQNIA